MATISSNWTGWWNWSATASWTGAVVPVLWDKVNILTWDIITVDDTSRAGGDDTSTAINLSGTLKASRTANSTLVVRWELNIDNQGVFDYGKSADSIPSTIIAKLQLNDSATLSDGKWGLTCDYNGSYYVYGATKTTNTYLTTQLTASGTSFDVNDNTNWAIGDTLIIGTTASGNTGSQTEERSISNISGNTITISAAITNLHEINGRVWNFTKSVVMEAFNSSYASYQNINSSSSSVNGSREIQHVECRFLGDSAASIKYGSYRFNGTRNSTTFTSIGNITIYTPDNYGMDFHDCQPERTTVTDCAIYHNSWGNSGFYSRQGSVVTFDDCVVYRSWAGLVTSWSQWWVNTIFNNCWVIGCTTGFSNSSGQGFKINNCVFASNDRACYFWWGASPTFNNCAIGYSSGSYNGSCVYGFLVATNSYIEPLFNDCTYNVTNDYNALTSASTGFKLFISNKDVNPSIQEIYTSTGILYRDNTTFKTGWASLRIEPLSSTDIVSNTWQIFAPTGELVVVSWYLRKNTSYWSTNLPKVTLSWLGITESTFIMTDIDDTWAQFTVSWIQTTGTDWILTLQADFQSGTTGAKAWIDWIVAPATIAVNSWDFGYWAWWKPAELIASNFTSADDIWNKLTSDITLTGSIGVFIKKLLSVAKFLGLK